MENGAGDLKFFNLIKNAQEEKEYFDLAKVELSDKIIRAIRAILLDGRPSDKLIEQIESNKAKIRKNKSEESEQILRILEHREEIRQLFVHRAETKLSKIGESSAKKALEESVVVPLLFPDRFKGFFAPPKGILLIGASGKGKAMLADSVANASSATLFNIPVSSIIAKSGKESVQFVKTLFQMARNCEKAVIFIDQIDALLRRGTKRCEKAGEEFLLQLDALSSPSSADHIFVLGATERPQEMDEKAIGRFGTQIAVGVPNGGGDGAVEVLRGIVEANKCNFDLSDRDMEQLATMSSHFSLDDWRSVCQSANIGIVLSAGGANQVATDHLPKVRRIKKGDLEKAIEKRKAEKAQNLLDL